MGKYTLEEIYGVKAKYMLPEKVALVLEGGGTRGYYSAGVMEAFAKAGIMFPYIIGVSAGAANSLSYVSGQLGRNKQIIENFVSDKRYVGFANYVKKRSIFGMDFIFGDLPEKHCFFDWDCFFRNETNYLAGAFDCEKGESVWFTKEHLHRNLGAIVASCSVPFFSPMVKYDKRILLDGGILDPIPIEKSIADGNEFHVIVLTRNEGYKKQKSGTKWMEFYYRKFPKLIEIMRERHLRYNNLILLCEQLEREGKAIIIRPSQSLEVDRMTKNVDKLLALYQEGEEEAASVVQLLREYISKDGGNK